MGAGALKVTVQVLVPGPVSDAGLQVRLLTVTAAGTVTTPPDDEVVMGMAVEEDEDAFVT